MPPAANTSQAGSRPGRARALGAGILLSAASIAVVLGAIEAAFRLAPATLLPPGSYGAGVRHEKLGLNVHATPVLYTKHGFVRRVPNRDGFLDADHPPGRPPGVTRIAVFGDSYVESLQVPLEETFHRRAQERLGGGTEWLAYGISGWGTLHAFLAFQAFAPRDDPAIAVYIFVENDPGDSDQIIRSHAASGIRALPGAVLAADGEHWDVQATASPESERFWFRAGKWLQSRSLLAQVVGNRLVVLRRRGVQVTEDRALREMSGTAGVVPDMNDLASTWPGEARARAERLGRLILRDWKRAAESRHTELIVLYVPRGNDQLVGRIAESDTWLPWLRTTCTELDLPLVDLSPALRAALEAGREPYGDHWTPTGHAAVADVLVEVVRPLLRTAYR